MWMIETHVVNACMSGSFRSGWFFNLLNTSNGYVSVTFIFCAGAGFWLAASRKWDSYLNLDPPLWKYIQRLGFILLIAYWLHIPEFSLQKYLIAPLERQNILWICDVLHAIVIASLLALATMFIVRNTTALMWSMVLLAIVFFFGAPFVWMLEPDTFIHRSLGSYISRPPAAAFPLFPWCGYFFTGAAITAFFMKSTEAQRFKITQWLVILGVIVSGLTLVIEFLSPFPYLLNYGWGQNWYLCSPGNSLFRVSGTMITFGALYLMSDWIQSNEIGDKITKWLTLLGQESLFVYVFHLMIVYGSPVNLGLSYFIGPSYKPLATIIITCLTVVAVYYSTHLWFDFKREQPERQKRFIQLFALLFIAIFLLTTPAFVDWANAWIQERFPQAVTTN